MREYDEPIWISVLKVFGFFSCLWLCLIAIVLLFSNCSSKPPLDSSQLALAAGQSTQLVGGCHSPLGVGYQYCPVYKGARLPVIELVFLNKASYAVGNCDMGLLQTGAVDGPKIVQVDLSSLSDTAETRGFCFINVTSIEYFPASVNSTVLYSIAHSGWVIVEELSSAFSIQFPQILAAFCYKVSRTDKGRTQINKVNCQ